MTYGKKIVDVKFRGEGVQKDIPYNLSMDVSDVAREVVSMGRLLRAGFDMHFANKGHTCWMEYRGASTRIEEDDPNSEAPLFYLIMEVQPILEADGTPTVENVSAVDMPEDIAMDCEVELTGLTAMSSCMSLEAGVEERH